MKQHKHIIHTALLTLSMTAATAALASSATIPNTFTSGTAAVASDVNDNFTALKTAIDDNDSRITSLETATGAVSIPPSAFVSNGDLGCEYKTSTSKNYGFIQTGAPGSCQLVAPVYLPHGRTMVGLTCYLLDNEDPSDFDITFSRHDMTDPLSTANADGLYSLTTNFQQDAAVTPKTDTTLNGSPDDAVIDNTTYHYQLRVSIDAGFTGGDSLSMFGCVVSYE